MSEYIDKNRVQYILELLNNIILWLSGFWLTCRMPILHPRNPQIVDLDEVRLTQLQRQRGPTPDKQDKVFPYPEFGWLYI